MIAQLSGREIERIDPPVLRILRLGLYQIHWMRVPDHAAVNESVELAKKVAPRGRGFVNAILRKAGRHDLDGLVPAGEDEDASSIRLSHPEWLMRKWSETFGPERAHAIAAANQEPSHPDLFIDTRRQAVDEVETRLVEAEIDFERSPFVPDMLRVFGPTTALADLIESGRVWPMDEGSAIVAMLAGRNNSVLDLAAAPGGKTLQMLSRSNRVVSHDISLQRFEPLIRFRHHDPRISIVVGDGTRPPFRSRFDTVLLDAPCSATGIIRKHPEIKWRLSEELIHRVASLQRALIGEALSLTGRRLIYATCSLEREENDAVVRDAIGPGGEFEIGDLREELPQSLQRYVSRGVLRLTPESGTDGFTAIMIVRCDTGHS